MKRDIKFRGKSIKGFGYNVIGTWFYGGVITNLHGNEVHIAYFDEDMMSWRNVPIDPETIGQFTGVNDKDGKEIYEGDIIRWHDIVTSDYPITFSNGVFCLDDRTDENFHHHRHEICNKWEVIGNIYDNKELLNNGHS